MFVSIQRKRVVTRYSLVLPQVRATVLPLLQPLPRLSLSLGRQEMERGRGLGTGVPVAQWEQRGVQVLQDRGNLTSTLVMWTLVR